MNRILTEIQSGQFAKEWVLENQANRPVFSSLREAESRGQIEAVGKELRAMMSWMRKR